MASTHKNLVFHIVYSTKYRRNYSTKHRRNLIMDDVQERLFDEGHIA